MSEQRIYELLFWMWLTLSVGTILLHIKKSYKLKTNIPKRLKVTYTDGRVGMEFIYEVSENKIEDVDTGESFEETDVSSFELEDFEEEKEKVKEWNYEGEWLKNSKYKETNLYGE